MGLKIDEVNYCINSDNDVPEIYIKGEQAAVVSCSTQYVTSTEEPGTKLLVATFYLKSEQNINNEPKLHSIYINKITSKVFCS